MKLKIQPTKDFVEYITHATIAIYCRSIDNIEFYDEQRVSKRTLDNFTTMMLGATAKSSVSLQPNLGNRLQIV